MIGLFYRNRLINQNDIKMTWMICTGKIIFAKIFNYFYLKFYENYY